MSYNVLVIPLFEKQAKRLAKKYPSLKKELAELFENLASYPDQGKALGNNFYKIRLAIHSKGKGKSGGARIITYVRIIDSEVYLTSIYDKSEKSNITNKELEEIFKSIE
ncbi:type II toxin-antitoxin system RelE/ParE family toxin [Dyadobacter subterraneus]|uniref:Type II toxin-antitoxin system RelE/ParE family toxin n=1 Tax=Dyadobacter subterraneus TaxID=2773304 RepID=A0ABR9W5B4_9BACT|nr:type II toxin-antitoxin system RelE/ParE family toxin [Dyadobacter subterraneus]MBE9460657.1 type II toxin-antitoxin system RelE/ParE family toxin [Dyadobacter subterraneus]